MNYELKPTKVEEAVAAVSYLSEASGLSKTVVKDAMNKGAVWITDQGWTRRLRRAKAMLSPGQEISFYYNVLIIGTTPLKPTLIEDSKDFSIWIKPAGVTSGGTRYGDHCAIDRIVEKTLDRPCFLVHRLDRFASGLMVIAHNKRTAAQLSGQFEARTVTKHYEAIVLGDLFQALSHKPYKTLIIDTEINKKSAISNVTPIAGNDNYSKVNVEIETGRKHQIRIHLSSIGHPILGDRRYGGVPLLNEAVIAETLDERSVLEKSLVDETFVEENPVEEALEEEALEEEISAAETLPETTLPELQLASVELGFTILGEDGEPKQLSWSLPEALRPQLPNESN